MEVKAKARFIRISPKKVRLVIDVIRGMDVSAAENQLRFSDKAAARTVLKLLQSAIANALNNNGLEKDNLYIKAITADDGPTLKRWMPRAFGRATTIRKRSTHINILLGEKIPTEGKKKEAKKEKVEEVKTVKAESMDLKELKSAKDNSKRGVNEFGVKKGNIAGVKKKVFNRKAA